MYTNSGNREFMSQKAQTVPTRLTKFLACGFRPVQSSPYRNATICECLGMRFTAIFEINDDRSLALMLMHNATHDNRAPLEKRTSRMITIGKIVLLALAVPAACTVNAVAPTDGTYKHLPLPYALNPGLQFSVRRQGIGHGIETPVYPQILTGDWIATRRGQIDPLHSVPLLQMP